MLNINKKAFTLVELIVVITILAILGTIGFISLQGYSSEARDSKRVTDLGQIRTGIQVYQAKEGVVPEPSETKTIIGSGTTNLIIQGYAGTGVLNNIRVNDDAKDPLEDNYYTYSTNGAKTKFQLLALLENQETAYNVIPTTYANYETRDLYSLGDKLGILLDSTTNTPVQELGETEVDLNTNSTEYKAVFSKSDIQTLSGTSLHQEIVTKSDNTGVEEENIVYSSCKEILDNGVSTGDGTYTIDPENNGVGFEVYCDMTTDGGGWTRVGYTQDLAYENHFSGDAYRWLQNNFLLEYTNDKINAIRSVSSEAKQKYVGLCDGVIHYYYVNGGNYDYSFGFRFHTGIEHTPSSVNYGYGITVAQDGCKTNGGEGGTLNNSTIFEINDLNLPVMNVYSRDNGDPSEYFGSPLTNNPAWFR